MPNCPFWELCHFSFLVVTSWVNRSIKQILQWKLHNERLLSSPLHAAAAAAKSLQSCPTLCNPTDGSPPGSPIPGILQARTLEWVAISFSTPLHAYPSIQFYLDTSVTQFNLAFLRKSSTSLSLFLFFLVAHMWDLSSTQCQGNLFSFFLFCVQHLLLSLSPFFALEPNIGEHNNPDSLSFSELLFSAKRHNKIIKQNTESHDLTQAFTLICVLSYCFIRLLLILSLTLIISPMPLRWYFKLLTT